MRWRILAVATLVFVCGCRPEELLSVHPSFTDRDLVNKDDLVGKWTEDGTAAFVAIRKGPDASYLSRWGFEDVNEVYETRFVNLRGRLFLDLYPARSGKGDRGLFSKLEVPVHAVFHVEHSEPNLLLSVPDVEALVRKGPSSLDAHSVVRGDVRPREVQGDPNAPAPGGTGGGTPSLLLTYPTHELQDFLVAMADDKEVMRPYVKLTRCRPLYGARDLVFDKDLCGEYRSQPADANEEVTFLAIERCGEKAYVLRSRTKGTPDRIWCHLIRTGGFNILGMFVENPADERDPTGAGLAFTPDACLALYRKDAGFALKSLSYPVVKHLIDGDLSSEDRREYEAPESYDGTFVRIEKDIRKASSSGEVTCSGGSSK